MKAYKLFTTLSFCLLLASYSNAKMWKVSTVQDIKSALNKCSPGDILMMTNGTWKDANIAFRANGTQEQPITLMAETPGSVVLTGQSKIDIAGKNLIVSGIFFNNETIDVGSVVHFSSISENCRLTNSAIVNDTLKGKSNIKWVVLEGTKNRVDHSYFRNKLSLGPLVSVVVANYPNYHLIDSNYFAFRKPFNGNGAEIIRISPDKIQKTVSNTIVAYNYFEDCDGEAEFISSKSNNNVIKYNTFRRCQGALSLRWGDSCLVEENYFLGENVPNTGGVIMFGSGHKIINNYFYQLTGTDLYATLAIMNGSSTLRGLKDGSFDLYQPVKNIVIANNTFLENKQNIVVGLAPKWRQEQRDLAPENVLILNNVFSNSNEPFINLASKNAQDIKAESNAYNDGSIGLDTDNKNKMVNLSLKKEQDISVITNASDLPSATSVSSVQPGSDQNNVSNMKIGSQLSFNATANKPLTGKEIGVNWPIE